MYVCKSNKNSSERLFANSFISSSKLQEILLEVKEAIQITSPDSDIGMKRLHLYYDMKLVTFGIGRVLKFYNSIFSFYPAIYKTAADIVSVRASTNSHYRPK